MALKDLEKILVDDLDHQEIDRKLEKLKGFTND
jgi:hypothetical protein